MISGPSVLEICAGAGGQSRGLEIAGFHHALAVEIDRDAADTLLLNRPQWSVHHGDVREISGNDYRGIDLLAGGVPCPPFSAAGKQLGADDERDLFPEALRLVRESRPKAVMLENVKGLAGTRFDGYRKQIIHELQAMGYVTDWQLVFSRDFGVSQLRPRFILIAVKEKYAHRFQWPVDAITPPTVGELLLPEMSSLGWSGARLWAAKADGIAPTIVGGSKKHGGADLGPTRARQAWLKLAVDGRGVADSPPSADLPETHIPRLTNRMVATVQGFEDSWAFSGRKTSVYRQIGNAFPPPVAAAIGASLMNAIGASPLRQAA